MRDFGAPYNRAWRRNQARPRWHRQAESTGQRHRNLIEYKTRSIQRLGRSRMSELFYMHGGEYAPYAPEDYTEVNLARVLAYITSKRDEPAHALALKTNPHQVSSLEQLASEQLASKPTSSNASPTLAALPLPLPLRDVHNTVTAPRGPDTCRMTRSHSTGRVVPLAA